MANSKQTGLELATLSAPFNSQMTDLANKASSANSTSGAITQSERLFTTRSRSVNYLDGGGDRGERAFIKILTTDTARSLNRNGTSSHGSATPTSLGSSNSGVLKDAVTGSGYASFLLTDLNCNLEEKLQVVEVFGDAEVTYYFGRQPIMFNFSGILIDSVDNNWFVEWLEMYSHVLRGTELARNYELVRIVLPNMIIDGTVTRMGWSQNSSRDVDIPFQFSFLAKQITPKPVTVPNKPLTNDPVINWSKASGFLTKAGQNSIKLKSLQDKVQDLQNVIANPLSSVKDYATSLTSLSSGPTHVSQSGASVDGVGTSGTGFITSANSLFSGLNSNLSGVRASLFSPIYGVLSSLTKLIKTAGADVSSVISSFTNPVRNILRDVRNVSNQAIGVVNLVNNTIHSISNQVTGFDREIAYTISSLKNAAGVISASPKTISSSLKELFNSGRLPITSKFITGNKPRLNTSARVAGKLALLNSGQRHTAETGAKL